MFHRVLYAVIPSEAPQTTKVRRTLTFGVEIECLMSRDNLRVEAERSGLVYQYEGYNHTDNKHYYKFVSDASIRGENPIECVSPILSGKRGLDSLKNCCFTLNAAGATVNKSTGLHVHVGADHLTGEQYVNVFKNYKALESVIDGFMARSRRGNDSCWCKSLAHFDYQYCRNQHDVYNEMNGDRYYKVNPVAFYRHHTIEFRQHQGTTDFKKISAWVNFCVKLVAWSENNVLTSPVESINDVPFLTKTEKAYFTRRAKELA